MANLFVLEVLFLLQPATNTPLVCANTIQTLFNHIFETSFNTQLEGGADEPLYQPATDSAPAKILFRDDYVSSAMHEVSHWVIAGKARRQLEDYGYWYEADGRDFAQQKSFEQVEVKPQAVELLLHYAAGMVFRVSVDNLALPEYDSTPFKEAVYGQVKRYLDHRFHDSLPPRALSFIKALTSYRNIELKDDAQLNLWLMQAVAR